MSIHTEGKNVRSPKHRHMWTYTSHWREELRALNSHSSSINGFGHANYSNTCTAKHQYTSGLIRVIEGKDFALTYNLSSVNMFWHANGSTMRNAKHGKEMKVFGHA